MRCSGTIVHSVLLHAVCAVESCTLVLHPVCVKERKRRRGGEREKEKGREIKGERERENKKERVCVCVYVCARERQS